jgi:hypothetical protein
VDNVLYILMFAIIFFVAVGGTLLSIRLLHSRKHEDTEMPPELNKMRRRADENAKEAEETARRVRRLQYLVEVQRGQR